MGKSNEQNKKSRIDQIRADLEKKLAEVDVSKEQKVDKKNDIVEQDVNQHLKTSDTTPTFEISEPIEIIAAVKKTTVNEIKKETVVGEIVKNTSTSKAFDNSKNDNSSVNTSMNSNSLENSNVGEIDSTEYIEEKATEKAKINYLLYILLAGLLFFIGYLLNGYFKGAKKLEQKKLDRIISQYKNKSYLDSIELADANNQLLDIQNQKFIDSIANTYKNEIIGVNNVKKNQNKYFESEKSNPKIASKNAKPVVIDRSLVTNNTQPIINNVSSKPSTDDLKDGERITKPVIDAKPVIDDKRKSKVESDDIVIDDKNKNTVKNKDVVYVKSNEKSLKKKVDAEKELLNTKNDDVKNTDKTLSVIKKKSIVISPVYPGCEKKRTELLRKRCLTSKMVGYVQRKFNTDVTQNIGLKTGYHKIKVSFVIDKNGDAVVLKVRTDNKNLENEAIKVIQSLPRMTPGRRDGKFVPVRYSIPIQFKVGE